jgi:flagellin-specific chaperone FliS
LIDAEGAAWDDFVADTVSGFEAVVEAERDALTELSFEELVAWNNAADAATSDLNDEIDAAIAAMDEAIAEKTAIIDATIADLTDNYVDRFWEQLEELYNHISHHERQALVWKALHKKEEFIAAINALRDMLVASLGDTRATLVGELNDERDGFAASIGEARSGIINFTEANRANLEDASNEARAAIGARAVSDTDALDAFFLAEGKEL